MLKGRYNAESIDVGSASVSNITWFHHSTLDTSKLMKTQFCELDAACDISPVTSHSRWKLSTL